MTGNTMYESQPLRSESIFAEGHEHREGAEEPYRLND